MYSNLGEIYSIDMSVIPQDFDIEEFLKIWQEQRYQLEVDFTGGKEVVGMITNYVDI